MPAFYSKFLGPTLGARVHEILQQSHDEQMSLYEEVAMTRIAAQEAIKLSAPLFDEETAAKLSVETKALMAETLRSAMDGVKEMVVAASKIENAAHDRVSLKVVNLIVYQIVCAVHEACGDEHVDLAQAIAKLIDERVRLPMNDKVDPTIHVNFLESPKENTGAAIRVS